MTEKSGPGQADKKAAEDKTAQVAKENKEQTEAAAAEPRSSAEKVQQAESDDKTAGVVVDPFPAYEDKSLKELRSEASARGVEINRDVEKAHLVAALRATDPSPAYDVMPLEQLREQATEKSLELDPEFEKAHLVTELRAADTHTD
jgi:hypothetical protein